MSKIVRSAVLPREIMFLPRVMLRLPSAIVRLSFAVLSLIYVGGTVALGFTATSFSGLQFEIPGPAPVIAENTQLVPVVFGPMPLTDFDMVSQAPVAVDQVEDALQVAEIEAETKVIVEPSVQNTAKDVRVIAQSTDVQDQTPEFKVAAVNPATISMPVAAAPIRQSLIEMSPVNVYRADERFHAANPEATTPPIPLSRAKRPILQVIPASVAVIVPVRSVSIDPLLNDDADGTWPRRLDQVNARQNLEKFVFAQNQQSNIFLMEVNIEGWGIEKLFVPSTNVGEE